MSVRRVLCRVGVWLALPIAIAGCGGAGSHHPSRESHRGTSGPLAQLLNHEYPSGRYSVTGSWSLVRERIPGGYIVITGGQYTNGKQSYKRLVGHIERLNNGTVDNLGLPVEVGQGEPLEMGGASGCVGHHAYSLAYGLLRNPRDTVTVRERGAAIVLKRVAIPASFFPKGVLLYALFGKGPTRVVARTPSGEVVREDVSSGREAGGVACSSR